MPFTDLPDLSFPTLDYGSRETPTDLRVLLYKGASALNRDRARLAIEDGQLGKPQGERIALVAKLHDELCAQIAKGRSRVTIENRVNALRELFAWCDAQQRKITLATAATQYKDWTEAMLHRVRVLKNLKSNSAYTSAGRADQVLAKVLGMRGLKNHTRLRRQYKNKKRALGTQADKQNLEDSIGFGHFLLDISDALTLEAVRGKLPLTITLRKGGELTESSGGASPDTMRRLEASGELATLNKMRGRFDGLQQDTSSRARYPLINLRIEAELLIFLSQTGMNLAQAHRLPRGEFRFRTDGDDALVYRVRKGRRGGDADFRIYREYRPLFERYLAWLDAVIPFEDDLRLFPFIYPTAVPARDHPPGFRSIQARCKAIGIKWVGPLKLRVTRVNWILRRSRDPAMTAEMHQHSQETLLRVYDQPHHQVAAAEITRFHKLTDPSISPPGPGACIQVLRAPKAVADKPPEAPSPDCVNPAGCLFCVFHRDLDTPDYVWSLASYRSLKTIELGRYTPPSKDAPPHPAVALIARISAKIDAIRDSSEIRCLWAREAIERVREGRYHPQWSGFILCLELAK